MSNEYYLEEDAYKIGKLLNQLRQAIDVSASYPGPQVVSGGYWGRTQGDPHAPRGLYQESGYVSDRTTGLDPVHVNTIIGKLERHGWRVRCCLEDRLHNVGDFRHVGNVSGQQASNQLHSGERSVGEEAEKCRKLLAEVSSAIQAARQALSLAGPPGQTGRHGLVGLVGATVTQGHAAGRLYLTHDLLDETLYRLNEYRPTIPKADADPGPELVPYLGRQSNDRNVGIVEKVAIGDGFLPRTLPSTHEPAKPYWSAPDPNNPLQRANYDRYYGLLF